jgi:hypothetical protein
MALELTEKEAGRLDNLRRIPDSFRGRRSGYSNQTETLTVVSYADEISKLDANTTIIHLSFRPTIKDICKLLDACPRLRTIQAPQHVIYMLSESATRAIKFKDIQLVEGTVREVQSRKPIIL